MAITNKSCGQNRFSVIFKKNILIIRRFVCISEFTVVANLFHVDSLDVDIQAVVVVVVAVVAVVEHMHRDTCHNFEFVVLAGNFGN